ncbi:uncharacterized protein WCC33_004109 [Rhinophrynus dorsalis]
MEKAMCPPGRPALEGKGQYYADILDFLESVLQTDEPPDQGGGENPTVESGLIKILGVWFGGKGAALKFWDERLAKVRQKFGLWSLRDLTIEGKILVLQNEILPVLQYMAQAWPPLATICRAITRAVFLFIWGSKMDRVKRAVMYKEPHKGGKGVPDIPTMLRAFFVCNCVRRTLRESDQGSAGNAMSHFFLLPLWRGLGWERWDSSIPYNWTTPWFYQDVGRFVRENQLEGVKPELWTPKVIYKLIRAGGGCVAEESALHVFWQCPFAQSLLDDLENELKDSVPKRHLSYHSVLYGLFPGTHSYGAIQEAWCIMCCVKDALWFARNRLALRREQVTTQDCRRLIHSLLRDYNILDSPEEED